MEPFVNDFSSFETNLLEQLSTTPPNETIDSIFDLSNPDVETPFEPNNHVAINLHEQENIERGELVFDPTREILEDIVLPSDEEMKEMMLLLEDEVVDVMVNPLESSEGENEPPSDDLVDVTKDQVNEKSASGKQMRTNWTMEEHRMFLLGLRVHGKGKWKIISKDFIPTKTAIQIASHAQKYFNHQKPHPKGKKRSRPSIHDIRNINPFLPTICFDNINVMPNQCYLSNVQCYLSNVGVLDHDNSTSNFNISNDIISPTSESNNFQTTQGNEGEDIASTSTSLGPFEMSSFGPSSF